MKHFLIFCLLGSSLMAQPTKALYKFGKKVRFFARTGYTLANYQGAWDGKETINLTKEFDPLAPKNDTNTILSGIFTLPNVHQEQYFTVGLGSTINQHEISINGSMTTFSDNTEFIGLDFEYGYWFRWRQPWRFLTGIGYDYSILEWKNAFVYNNTSKELDGTKADGVLTNKGFHTRLAGGYFTKYFAVVPSLIYRYHSLSDLNIPNNTRQSFKLTGSSINHSFESRLDFYILW